MYVGIFVCIICGHRNVSVLISNFREMIFTLEGQVLSCGEALEGYAMWFNGVLGIDW